MHAVAGAVFAGAAGWLNIVVMVLALDAIKIALFALHTVVRAVLVATRRTMPHAELRGAERQRHGFGRSDRLPSPSILSHSSTNLRLLSEARSRLGPGPLRWARLRGRRVAPKTESEADE